MLSRLRYRLQRSAVRPSFAPHASAESKRARRLKDETISLVEVGETIHAAFPWLPDTRLSEAQDSGNVQKIADFLNIAVLSPTQMPKWAL